MQFRTRKDRRGVALIMVMVLIVMISLGAYSFAQMMTAQESATVMSGRRLQAQAAVASGVEYLKDYLVLSTEDKEILGGHWDNASYFKGIVVGGPDQGNTRFCIISIVEDQFGEPTGIRYGLTDEGSKLNINQLASEAYAASVATEDDLSAEESTELAELEEESATTESQRNALMALPGMTETVADSILDWIDADDITRDFGAEAPEYSFLGYAPRNGPISSLDELLLIQGVTNELLYGADRNHNGMLDEHERNDAAAIADGSGSMARGWSAYLTTNSKDAIESLDPSVDLNQDDLELLYEELIDAGFDEDFAAYTVVYRQSGPFKLEIPEDAPDDFEPPVPEPISGRQLDFSKTGETEIASVLDLLGSTSMGSFAEPGREQPVQALVESPYSDAAGLGTILPTMMGQLTAGEMGGSSGVNTNHCSSTVMSGLPGLDTNVVQNILQMQDRNGISGDANYFYPTWPLGLGAVTIEQMKQLMPYVAGQGTIFRAQVVGYSDIPGVFARSEVVIDASEEQPRVLSWRDLSHLGLGFPLETLTQ